MFQFQLPDIGEGVVEAEVIAWHVAEGDDVSLDQVLVELMTDKANVEIPSPAAGRVVKLRFREGDIVPVGAVMIEIDDGVEAGADVVAAPERREEPQPAEASPPPPSPPAEGGGPGSTQPPAQPERPTSSQRATRGRSADGVRAVPAVRSLAERLGVDLAAVTGTGPGGRIMRRDVESAAAAPRAAVAPRPPAKATSTPPAESPAQGSSRGAPRSSPENDAADWTRLPLRGVRRAIARHMSEARKRAAHFTYVEELDVTELMQRRARFAPELSPLAFLARATLRVLPAYPRLNASIDDERGEIILKERVHLGIAVAAEEGLVVPVISNAALLDTRSLAAQIDELATRAREGKLVPAQLRGGTFTISSLGKLGGIVSTPIVNHPEVAILGVNAVRSLPRYKDEVLTPREVMNLSVSVDHRIADGQDAALFVRDLARILEAADFPDVFASGDGQEG